MVFQWIVGLITIIALVIVFFSDAFTGKKKSSSYFIKAQKPANKPERTPDFKENKSYDSFFEKLNAQ